MFKNCFLFLVLVICIIVFPMLLNLIISKPAIFQVAGNEGDWIGFWGNYLGSIVAILGIGGTRGQVPCPTISYQLIKNSYKTTR